MADGLFPAALKDDLAWIAILQAALK